MDIFESFCQIYHEETEKSVDEITREMKLKFCNEFGINLGASDRNISILIATNFSIALKEEFIRRKKESKQI
ncbi:hypothetical protein NDK43_05490 [Neobacillus pocheonensis]|uniref:Uncharacterized protein n=1 Tax=Neobacillus pocheonensis TaxID=363869 RepID=A0ABT0W6I4_9BACI|nr:hypothetical protein [Neobacillus pocheonensis]